MSVCSSATDKPRSLTQEEKSGPSGSDDHSSFLDLLRGDPLSSEESKSESTAIHVYYVRLV